MKGLLAIALLIVQTLLLAVGSSAYAQGIICTHLGCNQLIFAVLGVYSFVVFYMLVLYALVTGLLGTMFGLRIKEIDIFRGPVRSERRFAGIVIRTRTIPVGSQVRFWGPQDRAEEGYRPGQSLEGLPIWQYAVLAFGGHIALLAFACTVLGTGTLQGLLSAFPQIVQGALHPIAYALPAIREFYALYAADAWAASAVFATKMVAVDLFPHAGSPLVMLYYRIRNRANRFALESDRVVSVNSLPMLVLLGLVLAGASWAFALCLYFFEYASL